MKLQFSCMAIFAMMLYACNNGASTAQKDMQLPGKTITENNGTLNKDKFETADTIVGEKANNIPPQKDNSDWDKKIIKTANLQLQLEDYKKFNASIHESLKQFGAYIAEEKQEQTDYKIENTLSIKVPVVQFDDLVNSFTGNGIKIIEKNISSEDVTGETVDTKARMQAKMAVRDKYLQLLKQAKNMNEILQVQDEINGIQEDIEAAGGRINYLQHASAYSNITLTYYQYINGSSPNDEKPGFFTNLSRAFSTGTSLISNLVLFMISIWPLLLSAAFIWLYFKRSKHGKPATV
jgi:hypothetical protein